MRLSKHRRATIAEMDMTPMIDIVFLLIIFFVVTAAIEKEAVDETILLAKSYYVRPPEKQDPRQITVNVGYRGADSTAISIAGNFLPLANLEGTLRNAMRKHGNDIPVVIRADGRVKFEHVEKVIDVVGKAGLYRVSMSAEDQGKHN